MESPAQGLGHPAMDYQTVGMDAIDRRWERAKSKRNDMARGRKLVYFLGCS